MEIKTVPEMLFFLTEKGIELEFRGGFATDEPTIVITYKKMVGQEMKRQEFVILKSLYKVMKEDGLLIILKELYKNFQ